MPLCFLTKGTLQMLKQLFAAIRKQQLNEQEIYRIKPIIIQFELKLLFDEINDFLISDLDKKILHGR